MHEQEAYLISQNCQNKVVLLSYQ